MSNIENYSLSDDFKPDLFMPASTNDINDIAKEIDSILDTHNDYESIETHLMGDFRELNFGIKSEIVFESGEKDVRSYDTYFELVDETSTSPDEGTLKIGYDHRKKPYVEFNSIKINHDDTVNKLAYYASHLIKLIVFSEEEPDLKNDDYFMYTAGAGHGIIQRILESGSVPAIETVHRFYDNHETVDISSFEHKNMAEAIMSWLQKNENTRVKNTKALVVEMDENTEFSLHSQQIIKNHRRDDGLEIVTSRSLDYIETKQEDDTSKEDRSIEFNVEHKNDQLDLNLTTVVTHNGHTDFMDEMDERLRNLHSAYGGLDNKIVKKPIVADIAFFNQKLGEALKIIAQS